MNTFSRIVSAIFSPLLCPTYGTAIAVGTTILYFLPSDLIFSTIVMTFLMTCVVPATAIFALYRLGYVSDTGLNNRTERTYPYIITLLCYIGCGFFFYRANAPLWFCMFFAGGGAACLVNIIVNRWWKISAHAAGMAGLVALTIHVAVSRIAIVGMEWWITYAILATGLVMSARVYMKRHTLWQVIAGAANGFICVYFLTMI